MKKLLVIIDMQKGFVNEYTDELPAKIRDFVKSHDFDSVVATRFVNHPGTPCYTFEKWMDCMDGSVETELVDELDGLVDKVFDKDVYSCYNVEFKKYTDDYSVVYFAGVNTGCCVLHSAFDTYNHLKDTRIIEDLCGSTSGEDSHKAGIQILRECITKERVITSDEI